MTMTTTKQDKYFKWLCNFVYDDGFPVKYTRLLRKLFDTEFIYEDMDSNRAGDGISLRYRYDPNNYHLYLDDMPVTVLEILIGLAVRCEETIMYDEEYGNRIGLWFWEMINNIGLSANDDLNYDEREIDICLYRFMNRQYGPHGEYCAFRTKDNTDMSRIELWYQLQKHLIDISEV